MHCNLNRKYVTDMNTPTFDVFGPTRYGTRKTYHLPRTTPYSKYLESQGYTRSAFHKKGVKDCYINARNQVRMGNLNYPWVLVVYQKTKNGKINSIEFNHQTIESALTEAPPNGNWQIINTFTGQIAYEPRKFYFRN